MIPEPGRAAGDTFLSRRLTRLSFFDCEEGGRGVPLIQKFVTNRRVGFLIKAAQLSLNGFRLGFAASVPAIQDAGEKASSCEQAQAGSNGNDRCFHLCDLRFIPTRKITEIEHHGIDRPADMLLQLLVPGMNQRHLGKVGTSLSGRANGLFLDVEGENLSRISDAGGQKPGVVPVSRRRVNRDVSGLESVIDQLVGKAGRAEESFHDGIKLRAGFPGDPKIQEVVDRRANALPVWKRARGH